MTILTPFSNGTSQSPESNRQTQSSIVVPSSSSMSLEGPVTMSSGSIIAFTNSASKLLIDGDLTLASSQSVTLVSGNTLTIKGTLNATGATITAPAGSTVRADT